MRDRKRGRVKFYDLRLKIFDLWLKLVENVKNTDIFFKVWQPGRYAEKWSPEKMVREKWGGGQNLERPNVKRPIFRKFETSNIEITKVELFDFYIFEFILYFYDCLNYSNTQSTCLIIYHQIRNFLNFASFTNCKILKIC